ncbi:MAG TPA: BTAD domain-containing putative transcriptional regulator [Actinospica sp.]|nr:BTAD domain-containing putative transcriptional regulator [Actinospica sp.]
MAFRILGPLEIEVDGVPVHVGGPRPRALLAALLAHAGESVSVAHLIDQVWGEQPPATAVAALQMHVSALRKLLGSRVVTTATGYLLEAADHEVDARRFEAAIGDARSHLTRRPVRAAADLSAALALWRGEPFGGVSAGPDVRAARLKLSELRLSVLEDRLELELALGRHAQAAPELAGLAAEHPDRSRLARLHLLALYRCGRFGEAEAAYRALRERLAEEFGVEPPAEISALAAAVRRRDPTLDPPTAIPAPASRFIGRRGELDRLAERLGRTRLLTLTGPGGSGKTRLALELARETAADYPDGVSVVELAASTGGAAVAERLAAALSVRARPDEPLLATLAAQLRTARALILLDNCEHVLDGCAELAAELLSRCAGLRVLATSREPLGVGGEQVWPLTGMAVPAETASAARAGAAEAVRLLADRGAAARADFAISAQNAALAGRLCRSLDGLPLAIELAAAQLRALSLPELVDRLEHRLDRGLTLTDRRSRTTSDRHHTMHAAIDWSYRLLDPAEQALFRRLSVFADGCAAQAAATVTAFDDTPADATDDLLARLVDRSVLTAAPHRGGTRYRMLELIRRYAAERLAESGEFEELSRRHAAWCADLAQSAAQFGGADHAELAGMLDGEQANLRAAMEWCLAEGGDPERALEIASPLWWYWWARGLMAEGRGWLRRALSAVDPAPTPLRGSALRAAAALTRNSGDYAEARILGQQCLAVYASLSQPTGLISALGGLCVTAIAQQDFQAALGFGEESRRLAESGGDRLRHASALNNIGLALRCLGRLDEAAAAFADALGHWRGVGDRRGEAATLGNLGRLAWLRADAAESRRLYLESLAVYRDLDLAEGTLDVLEALAAVELHENRPARSLRLLTVTERERVRLGAPLFVQDEIEDCDRARAGARAALGDQAEAIISASHGEPLDALIDEMLGRQA